MPGEESTSKQEFLLEEIYLGIADEDVSMCSKFVPGEPLRALDQLIHREKFGRRDWTRTNDPHHVKVML
jgi:hypothetical protein